jgi:hypothetical protein
MKRRKPLLFLTFAIVMVALFAATEVIADSQFPTYTTCGNGTFTITYGGFANNTFVYYLTANPTKALAPGTKVVFGQSQRDCSKNAVLPGCVPGAGSTGNSKWLQGVYEMSAFTYTAASDPGGGDSQYVEVPATNSAIGGVDVAIDMGTKLGLQLCTSQIVGPGDKDEFPTQQCFTQTITYDTVETVDGGFYTPTCEVEICLNPFSSQVISGDTSGCESSGLLTLEQILPGLVNVQGDVHGVGQVKKHESPDTNCTTYQQEGYCYPPCCPGPPILDVGACLPYYPTCP